MVKKIKASNLRLAYIICRSSGTVSVPTKKKLNDKNQIKSGRLVPCDWDISSVCQYQSLQKNEKH